MAFGYKGYKGGYKAKSSSSRTTKTYANSKTKSYKPSSSGSKTKTSSSRTTQSYQKPSGPPAGYKYSSFDNAYHPPSWFAPKPAPRAKSKPAPKPAVTRKAAPIRPTSDKGSPTPTRVSDKGKPPGRPVSPLTPTKIPYVAPRVARVAEKYAPKPAAGRFKAGTTANQPVNPITRNAAALRATGDANRAASVAAAAAAAVRAANAARGITDKTKGLAPTSPLSPRIPTGGGVGGPIGGGGSRPGGGGGTGGTPLAPRPTPVPTPTTPRPPAVPQPPTTRPPAGPPTNVPGFGTLRGNPGTFGRFNRQRLQRGPRTGTSITPELLRRMALRRLGGF